METQFTNQRTGEPFTIEDVRAMTEQQGRDIIPQYETAQQLYGIYRKEGAAPLEAALAVLRKVAEAHVITA